MFKFLLRSSFHWGFLADQPPLVIWGLLVPSYPCPKLFRLTFGFKNWTVCILHKDLTYLLVAAPQTLVTEVPMKTVRLLHLHGEGGQGRAGQGTHASVHTGIRRRTTFTRVTMALKPTKTEISSNNAQEYHKIEDTTDDGNNKNLDKTPFHTPTNGITTVCIHPANDFPYILYIYIYVYIYISYR